MKQREDILVIGGGVIGVCSAYYLVEEGRQVTILDREGICAGSSYGNAGLIVPGHSIPLAAPGMLRRGLKWMLDAESPFYIKPRFELSLFSWLWRFRAACKEQPMRKGVSVLTGLSRASATLFDELIARESLSCDYQQNGLLILFKTDDGYRKGLEEGHLLREHGISLRDLSSGEARDIEPGVRPDIAGGIYFQDDAHLNPAEFVHGLAARVQQKGGIIRPGAEVLGFETSGNRISKVKTTQGDYHPEEVVLAAGAWSPHVVRDLRLKLPVQPGKGYSVTIKRSRTSPAVPLILSEAKVAITPLGPLMRLAGTLELSGLDHTISWRRVRSILRAPGDYLSVDWETDSQDVWCGLRPCAPDGLPIIGRAHKLENLIVATAHAMLGMTLGPITGQLVAQIVCRQTPAVDVTALRMERFE